jgi:hypothetical protein
MTKQLRDEVQGVDGDAAIAAAVIEEVMSKRSTRVAWLLGFLTGSAITEDARRDTDPRATRRGA